MTEERVLNREPEMSEMSARNLSPRQSRVVAVPCARNRTVKPHAPRIIHRDEERREERRRLSDCLKKLPTISGTLYLGYPDLLGPPRLESMRCWWMPAGVLSPFA